jgi:hypothetical protein
MTRSSVPSAGSKLRKVSVRSSSQAPSRTSSLAAKVAVVSTARSKMPSSRSGAASRMPPPTPSHAEIRAALGNVRSEEADWTRARRQYEESFTGRTAFGAAERMRAALQALG